MHGYQQQSEVAEKLYALSVTIQSLEDGSPEMVKVLQAESDRLKLNFDPKNWKLIEGWTEKVKRYKEPLFKFKVRDKEIAIQTHAESLSHTQVPKVVLPRYKGWGDVLRWSLLENVPGEFPFTCGYLSLSNGKVKIQHVCLPVKAVRNEPTGDFIM